jgi:translation initiation factor 6
VKGDSLSIKKFAVMGSPNIGIYSSATDRFSIFPTGLPSRKIDRVKDVLKVTVVSSDVGNSKLIGVLSAANSHSIVLPHYVTENEVNTIRKELEIDITIFHSTLTSLGNLILVNDKGAIVSPLFDRRELKILEDALHVEVVVGRILGHSLVGSLALATNKGVLVHPLATDDEKAQISEVLKVPVNLGTVNSGVIYVSSGIIANSYGALVGSATSGPELMMISALLQQ